MKWISVKDRLPEKNQLVLAITDAPPKSYREYEITEYFHEAKRWQILYGYNSTSRWKEDPEILYWMPLPERPNIHEGSTVESWLEEEGFTKEIKPIFFTSSQVMDINKTIGFTIGILEGIKLLVFTDKINVKALDVAIENLEEISQMIEGKF